MRSLAAFAILATAFAAGPGPKHLFGKDNLIAWCIVPFDAKMRGPEERAAMLARLGFKRFAYDWRDKDIPTFDAEVDALRKHGISLDAFWTPYPADPAKASKLPVILELLKRRGLKTQLWLSLGFDKGFDQLPHAEKVEIAAAAVRRVAALAKESGGSVGLYNHGGWYGEPANQVEIIKKAGASNVGIVYNFHHGHDHMDAFPALMKTMLPYLMAVNINGMRTGQKILPVGQGDREKEMLRTVIASGYRGPIGILGHRAEIDAEEALRLNLDGLKALLPSLR